MLASDGHQEAREQFWALCAFADSSFRVFHLCWNQGSWNKTPNSFPLTLFHIIPLLSISCSSPNVLDPSRPLSFMNDSSGSANDLPSIIKDLKLQQQRYPVFLCKQEEGWHCLEPASSCPGRDTKNAGIAGAGSRGRDILLLQEALLACGCCLFSLLPDGQSPLASIWHLLPEPGSHPVIHLPSELKALMR